MSNKINARLQHKIDTQENWEKAINFIPLKGELIIYDIDANNTSRRIKIGDGITPVNDLEFVSTQSDYEQNDSSKSDYIKNRTHYKEIIHQERVDLLPATEIDFPSLGEMGYTRTEPLNIQAGDKVKVLWDSQEYECAAQSFATLDPEGNTGMPSDGIAFGNLYYAFEVDPDSQDIPFLVVANYAPSGEEGGTISGCWITPTGESELTNPITVNIFTGGDKTVYHKLDLNYLPLSSSNISEDDNTIITSKPLLNYLRANQSDWDVSDSDDPRYIQNRPLYRDLWGTTTQLSSRTITLDGNGIYTSQEQLYNFNDIWNNSYDDINLTVYWHDGTYNCKLRKIYIEWTDEQGKYQSYSCFVFGNVSDIDSYNDTAPFLIYADFNPGTHKIGETYIKAYDGFTGDISLQIDIEYRYWGYHTLDNKYLDIGSLQANWGEENSSAPSYINNKPFYKYRSGESSISVASINLMFNDSGVCITQESFFNLNEYFNEWEPVDRSNVFAKCTWNDTEYKCKVRHLSCEYYDSNKGSNIVDYYYAFGNVSSINGDYSDTAPFLVYANYNPETHQYGETYIVSNDGSTGTVPFGVSWVYDYWRYNKLDNKYLDIGSLQANWDEENSSAPSYINNKLCYRYRVSGDNHVSYAGSFILSNEGTCVTSFAYLNMDEKFNDKEPTDYSNIPINVKWNNEEYNCRIRGFLDEYTDDGGNTLQHSCYVFGNVSSIDSNYSDTAPFLIYANYNPQTHEYGETYIVSQDGSTGEVSCEFRYSYEYWGYQKLDNKYLNLSTNVFPGDNYPVTGDAVYKAVINNISNHTHPASMIEEDASHRFVSDTEKTAWNNKVDKADGKGLSTNDYTTADKEKLDGISEGANNYTHPDTHPASMIEEDASHRFVSDTEKAAWNNKSNSDHNHDSDYLKLSGGTLTGDLILNGDPTSDNVAANKKYVDDAIALAIGTALGGSY